MFRRKLRRIVRKVSHGKELKLNSVCINAFLFLVFLQKQPPEVFYEKRCSQKFRKIDRNTPARFCFPVNFEKFIRTPFLQNTSGRMLWTFNFASLPELTFSYLRKCRKSLCFLEISIVENACLIPVKIAIKLI